MSIFKKNFYCTVQCTLVRVYVHIKKLSIRAAVMANRSITASMKKALRETQTLHAGCSKAEPKNFAPPQTPSRGRRTAKI